MNPACSLRTRTRFAIALALALAATTIAFAGTAHACSCAGEWSPKRWFAEADGAIIGKLVRVIDRSAANDYKPSFYEYRVKRVYKGGGRGLKKGMLVRVRAARDEATCGLPRKPGKKIGLFLDRRRKRWHSGLCSVRSAKQMRRAARQAGRPGTSGAAAANGC